MAKDNRNELKEEKKDPLSIELEEHLNFSDVAVGMTNFTTSEKICELVNQIFRSVFADYEGSTYERDQNCNPYINIFFNHRNIDNSAVPRRAFTPDIEEEEIENELVRKVKRNSRIMKYGNRYNITQDAKDAVPKFILNSVKNNKGKVNWNNVSMDVAQPGSREVLSKISYIDPVAIIAEIFGRNDGDIQYTYELRELNSLPNGSTLIEIKQINSVQLDRACREIGIVNPNGLGIISR